jgi:hypothetical protein
MKNYQTPSCKESTNYKPAILIKSNASGEWLLTGKINCGTRPTKYDNTKTQGTGTCSKILMGFELFFR